MKILITGATGFIGKNLVPELVSKSHKVRCLVRKTSRKEDINYLKKLKVELFNGDLINKKSLKGICRGIDIVYHLTGVLGSFNASEKLMFDINVRGTENILNESKEGKVKKFIFCSSAGVLGPIIKGGGSSPYSPSNLYEKTKVEAEKLVLKSKLDYIIMRPEFVYGPMDNHVLPLFKAIKYKKFFIIGDGNSLLHPTFIDDLIQAFIKCLDPKIKNQIYMIAGEKAIKVKTLYKLIAKKLNVKTNKILIPIPLATILAFILENSAKIFKFNPIITKSKIRFFTENRAFNTSKAREELGYNPIKLEKGIEKTIGWYKQKGYL